MANKDLPEPKRIQSLQRAMAVVEAIAASADGLRIQDLAKQVGLTPGAIHHIVDTLAAQGWVERIPQPVRYGLGPALAVLARRQQQGRLMRVVTEEMVALRSRLGFGSISLCEAAGSELLLTRTVDAARSDETTPVSGTVLPPYTSAASVIHLAFWPAERAQAFQEQRPFEVYGGMLWGDAARFQAAVIEARRNGFVDLPLKEAESVRIGVPVLAVGGGLAASLTLAVHRDPQAAVRRPLLISEGLRASARIRERLEGEAS